MDRKEALQLLRGGPEGVDDWNRWFLETADRVWLAYSHSSSELQMAARLPELNEADLASQQLRSAQLSGVNMREAKLIDADLHGAFLARADLREADLRGADLTNCDVSGADLTGCNLSGANLSEANLSGATMRWTGLDGTLFAGAILGPRQCIAVSPTVKRGLLGYLDPLGAPSRISQTDLSRASSLGDVDHSGPTVIDIESMMSVPAVDRVRFLRGCGVREPLVEYLPSLTEEAIQFYSCFISYSHEDKVFARRLHDQLQGRGIRCWLDEHQMLPGDDIYDTVNQAIRVWDKVLLCCSEASLKSWWVESEMDRAFEKERQLAEERDEKTLALIPLNLDGHLFDSWDNLRGTRVRSRLAADFTGWDTDNAKFEAAFEHVVKALRADEGARNEPPTPRL